MESPSVLDRTVLVSVSTERERLDHSSPIVFPAIDAAQRTTTKADYFDRTVLWFTPNQVIVDHPELHGRSVIPVRAARYGTTG